MSSFAYLTTVQQNLTRYGMTTYIILGNIGLICNMIVFLTPTLRRNPCSLYIFSASLCGLIGLNFSSVPVVYALDHPNPMSISALFCRLQFYFRHVFNQLMRTFFIFACIDRYAISSQNVRIRSFSQFHLALKITIAIPIFWFIVGILPTMLNELQNGRCEGVKGIGYIILSFYVTATVGVIPVVTMIVFGILMLKNLKHIRTRIQANSTSVSVDFRLRKRDRELMKVLLIEIVCYSCTTTPLFINLIYRSTTQTVVKNFDRQQIELFITYFTGTFILYLNNSLPFWIYIIKSQSFRSEFVNIFIHYFQLRRRISTFMC